MNPKSELLKFASSEKVIHFLYHYYLNREPATAEIAACMEHLSQRGDHLQSLVVSIAQSAESMAQANPRAHLSVEQKQSLFSCILKKGVKPFKSVVADRLVEAEIDRLRDRDKIEALTEAQVQLAQQNNQLSYQLNDHAQLLEQYKIDLANSQKTAAQLLERCSEIETKLEESERVQRALRQRISSLNRSNTLAAEGGIVTDSQPTEQNTNPELDGLYTELEAWFRGDAELVAERQKVYLPYLEPVLAEQESGTVLDLACGRGEWLALLKERGIKAQGVDLSENMISICQQQNLDVHLGDVVKFLSILKTDALSVITSFHLIEHLPFASLIALLDQSLNALCEGGMLILETPNPENLQVGACDFYIDPTHQRPLPPALMYFLLIQRGFEKVQVIRLHPREEDSSQPWLQGSMDYAVIGYKPRVLKND